jgi:hypothetical protein
MIPRTGKLINKRRASNAIYAFCMLVLFFQQFSTVALALSGEQKDVLKSGSHYFNIAAGCSGSSSNATDTAAATGSVIWPFATKSDSQYQRVDQGWDIQQTHKMVLQRQLAGWKLALLILRKEIRTIAAPGPRLRGKK